MPPRSQIHALQTGIEVTPHDGRKLDAIVSTDAHLALGLAVGMLNLDQVRTMVDIEGDEAVVRDILDAVEPSTPRAKSHL